MASTAKTPDPMPCSLAAILLPESRAHGCHMQKTLFQGTYWVHARTCVLEQFVHAGCASAAWVHGGSLGNDMGAGRRCLAPRVGGVRWSGPPCGGAAAWGLCAGGRVGVWSTRCLPNVRGRACVDAWAGAASGGSFRAVASVVVWGMARLLRGGRVLYGKVPNTAYSQGSQELVASAGAC